MEWEQRLWSFGIKDLKLVDQTIASWNRLVAWLEDLSGLRNAV